MENNNANKTAAGTAIQTKRIPLRYRVVRRGMPERYYHNAGGVVEVRDAYLAPRKDYKKIVGIAVLAVLLLLIFFSKTIYGYNLPVVTAAKPENGRLSKLEMSSGIAAYSEVGNIYNTVGGTVEEVLVNEGDTVKEGQELYRLSFDRDEAERKLREIQNSRSKLQVDIQNINIKLEKQKRYMTDLSEETYEEDEVSTYELDALAIDIRKARDEWQAARDSYEDGDADDIELDRARYALEALYLKQEELERKLEEQKEQAKESIKEQEKNQESKLKDYESDIASLQLDLRTKNIELSNLAIQEEPYKKALDDFDAYAAVTAPMDGTVISLSAVKGETVREEQLLASVGAAGAYVVECNVSLDNNFVLPDDTPELSNSSHVLNGTVTKITPTAQNKTVTIEIESDEVTAGETFDITFKKDSDTTYTLVPNGALNQDNDGYFVNQIKRRDGILGQEFYLERLDVYIGDSDSSNTAIVQGIRFFEPIVLISDKPVVSGDVIALSNEGDFFEK